MEWIYKEILLSYTEGTVNTCNSIDVPQKYAEWKKPDLPIPQNLHVWFSLYETLSEEYYVDGDGNQISGHIWGAGGEWEGAEGLSEHNGYALCFDAHSWRLTGQHTRSGHFTVCQLNLS